MSKNDPTTPAMERAEKVLRKHGVRSGKIEVASPRSSAAINAIIRDVRKANAGSEQ